jgi:hypothetical protein
VVPAPLVHQNFPSTNENPTKYSPSIDVSHRIKPADFAHGGKRTDRN